MLGNIPGTAIHVGLIFGIVVCVMAWVLMDHTTFGFATRIVGGNVITVCHGSAYHAGT